MHKDVTRKMILGALLAGVAVILSPFSFPVGPSRCFPFQHAVNVLAGVMLGPFWAVLSAFVTSCVRFMMGTGSILAFPGSMFGALAVGLVAQIKMPEKYRILSAAAEPLATSTIGAFTAALIVGGNPIATYYTLGAAFLLSSIPGALIGATALKLLKLRVPVSQF